MSNVLLVQKKTILFFLISFFSIFLCGIKSDYIWADKYVYQNYYEKGMSNEYSYIFSNLNDPFFVIINKFLYEIGFSFEITIFFIALITILLKFRAFQFSVKNYSLFLIFYFSFLFFLHDYIQIRIALGIAIALYGIYAIKNTLLTIFFLAIATYAHLSLFFLLVIYLIYIINNKKLKYLFFLIFSCLISFSINNGILGGNRVEQYIESEIYTATGKVTVIPVIFLILTIYSLFKYKYLIYKLEFLFLLFCLFIYFTTLNVPVIGVRYFEVATVFFLIIFTDFIKRDLLILFCSFMLFFLNLNNLIFREGSLLSGYLTHLGIL